MNTLTGNSFNEVFLILCVINNMIILHYKSDITQKHSDIANLKIEMTVWAYLTGLIFGASASVSKALVYDGNHIP